VDLLHSALFVVPHTQYVQVFLSHSFTCKNYTISAFTS